MGWINRMNEITMTPGAVNDEAVASGRVATVPALVGLIGAAVSLFGLPLFFVAASLPMSILGLALGIRQRNEIAMLFGTAGIVLAAIGFILG